MAHPPPLFSFIFGPNKQCEKGPSIMQRCDSSSRPLDRQYPPFTARPGLPPGIAMILYIRDSGC